MLTNKINALRYLENFFKLMQEDELVPRFSILDALVLLHINEHPGCAKSDLVEIVYGSRDANKSSKASGSTRKIRTHRCRKK